MCMIDITVNYDIALQKAIQKADDEIKLLYPDDYQSHEIARKKYNSLVKKYFMEYTEP